MIGQHYAIGFALVEVMVSLVVITTSTLAMAFITSHAQVAIRVAVKEHAARRLSVEMATWLRAGGAHSLSGISMNLMRRWIVISQLAQQAMRLSFTCGIGNGAYSLICPVRVLFCVAMGKHGTRQYFNGRVLQWRMNHHLGYSNWDGLIVAVRSIFIHRLCST